MRSGVRVNLTPAGSTTKSVTSNLLTRKNQSTGSTAKLRLSSESVLPQQLRQTQVRKDEQLGPDPHLSKDLDLVSTRVRTKSFLNLS